MGEFRGHAVQTSIRHRIRLRYNGVLCYVDGDNCPRGQCNVVNGQLYALNGQCNVVNGQFYVGNVL